MTDEELKQQEPGPSEEKLSQLKARVTELNRLAAEKDRELEAKQRQISALEQAIAEKESEIASLEQSATRSGEELKQAVSAYLSLVIEANPEVPPELITGDSIEAINDSLATAKNLVAKVRQGLETEATRLRVPAGAPARTLPDFSALSAREKIQYAIGGNK